MLISSKNKRDNTVFQFIVGFKNWSRDITTTQPSVSVDLLTTTREMRPQDRSIVCRIYYVFREPTG